MTVNWLEPIKVCSLLFVSNSSENDIFWTIQNWIAGVKNYLRIARRRG